jgi:hypothetical protein
MPDAISGSSRTYDEPSYYDDHLSQAGLNYCRTAHTVTSGFLCAEDATVSNACRSPTNDVDRFVCDDQKMAGLQHSVWDTTKDILKTIFGAFIGGKR